MYKNKLCPLCQSSAIIKTGGYNKLYYWAECTDQTCGYETGHHPTRAEAARAWIERDIKDNTKILEDTIINLRDEIKELKTRISIEERLPEVHNRVLVFMSPDHVHTRLCLYNNGYWVDDEGQSVNGVTHWQPILD